MTFILEFKPILLLILKLHIYQLINFFLILGDFSSNKLRTTFKALQSLTEKWRLSAPATTL